MDPAHGYLRDCEYGCFHVANEHSQMRNPVKHHWEVSDAGYNYYYCAVHRVYHCMASCSKVDQPCCGDCAPSYYNGADDVVWVREDDHQAIAYPLHGSNSGDTEPSSDVQPDANLGISVPNANEFPDSGSALDAIPRDDITYVNLIFPLMAHRRQRGLFLLRFTGYNGGPGYVICGRNMTQASFLHLAQYEAHGDHVMKSARLWACQELGSPFLPQDIRWVLWTIYMLCNEALRSRRPTEEEGWNWRSWLWHWYSRANELFEYYQINVSSPEEAWFNRPPPYTNPGPSPSNDQTGGGASGGQTTTPASSDVDDSMDQTFIADEESSDENANKNDEDDDDHDNDNQDDDEDDDSRLSGSGENRNHSESSSTELSSAESSSTETSSSETVIHLESSFSTMGFAATETSATKDAATEADTDQRVATVEKTSSSG